ncbi:MAG TPA: hypothetical protein VEL11_07380 [Candidatus Bathyarchaeia archaeon]|nr:hypothetical protein [Candidatus Bathyarchaeia archaeon]
MIDVQAKNTEISESLFPIVAKDLGMQLVVKELKRSGDYMNRYQRSRKTTMRMLAKQF